MVTAYSGKQKLRAVSYSTWRRFWLHVYDEPWPHPGFYALWGFADRCAEFASYRAGYRFYASHDTMATLGCCSVATAKRYARTLDRMGVLMKTGEFYHEPDMVGLGIPVRTLSVIVGYQKGRADNAY